MKRLDYLAKLEIEIDDGIVKTKYIVATDFSRLFTPLDS